jgi:para-nitrobenzyl esterase
MTDPSVPGEPHYVVAEIAAGALRGVRAGSVVSFKGIPYAADTGGVNRFMAPRPVAPWTGVRDALRYGDRCPQRAAQLPSAWAWYPSTEGALGEDCCVLNVFTPDLDAGASRPVLFYIHGGGFSRNAGQGRALDGSNLAKFGNAVVITVNHRLNIFGYANLGHLDQEFADAASAGQLDIIAALQWVKANAEVFGGDAGNVTVFGQSGGGSKINTLMAMPAATGLFHRAINMSGSSAFVLRPARDTEFVTDHLLRTLDIGKHNLRKIQEVPAERLLAAHYTTLKALHAEDSAPVIDGRHILHGPLTPEGLAMHASIPLLFGVTESEARWFMQDVRNFHVSEEQVKARVRAQFQFSEARAEATMAAFRKDVPSRSAADVLMAVASESLIRSHMLRAADAITSSRHAPLYFYHFAWKVPVDDGIWGSPHTVDIPFVFGTVDAAEEMTGGEQDAAEISRDIMSAIVAFARTGDPDNPRMPHWKAYDTSTRATMVIGSHPTLAQDYLGNDRRASEALGRPSVFQVVQGPLFRYGE